MPQQPQHLYTKIYITKPYLYKSILFTFSDHVTSVNAEDLFDIKILNLSTPDQVTPGSILGLELEINR